MIEFTKTEAYGFHHAIRGMRNSWGSHEKSDSYWESARALGCSDAFIIGDNDHALAMKLSKAGGSHSKFLRQIEVWVDINAPLYWWKEMDQYKFIVANSESTMHTIQRKPMTKDLFSFDTYGTAVEEVLATLEELRLRFLETKNKQFWRLLIQILPSGWMQKRTTKLNYQTIKGAYHDRKGHRLSEWEDFRMWARELPYSELITGEMK